MTSDAYKHVNRKDRSHRADTGEDPKGQVAKLKEIELWGGRLAAFSGAIGAVSIAAATQVWSYPYPRAIMLMAAGRTMNATMMAVIIVVIALVWRKLAESNPNKGQGSQGELGALGRFIFNSAFFFYGVLMVLFLTTTMAMTECVHYGHGDLCTKRADQITPEDAAFLTKKKMWGFW